MVSTEDYYPGSHLGEQTPCSAESVMVGKWSYVTEEIRLLSALGFAPIVCVNP